MLVVVFDENGSATGTRIDVCSGTTVATIGVGAQPAAIAAGGDGVWVSDEAGHVIEGWGLRS